MPDSEVQRALLISLAREAAFSQIMPLAVHPRAKHGVALRLRTLCRRALRLGSALDRSLCWQLRCHRQEEVRSHIARLVEREGHNIWRTAQTRHDDSTGDLHDEGTGTQRNGHNMTACRCDPIRGIVEGHMLPSLSKTLSQEGMSRWLRSASKTIYICGCQKMYSCLWREALCLAHRRRAALRRYMFRVYARLC